MCRKSAPRRAERLEFSSTAQKCYGVFQCLLGLAMIAITSLQIYYELRLHRVLLTFELATGVCCLLAGSYAYASGRSYQLRHLVCCLVLTSFVILTSFIVMVLYPTLLLLHPDQYDVRHELTSQRTILLAAAFTAALVECCIAMCQVIVSYSGVQYIVLRGYEGLSDPRPVAPSLVEASIDGSERLSEQTLLLRAQYDSYSRAQPPPINTSQQNVRTTSQNVCTTSLTEPVTLTTAAQPSAPPAYDGWLSRSGKWYR